MEFESPERDGADGRGRFGSVRRMPEIRGEPVPEPPPAIVPVPDLKTDPAYDVAGFSPSDGEVQLLSPGGSPLRVANPRDLLSPRVRPGPTYQRSKDWGIVHPAHQEWDVNRFGEAEGEAGR